MNIIHNYFNLYKQKSNAICMMDGWMLENGLTHLGDFVFVAFIIVYTSEIDGKTLMLYV